MTAWKNKWRVSTKLFPFTPMLHNPAEELRAIADWLDTTDESFVSIAFSGGHEDTAEFIVITGKFVTE